MRPRLRASFVALLLPAALATGQAFRDVGPAGSSPPPPAALGPGFPGAGTVLGTQPFPLFPAPPPPAPQHSPDSLGSTYDRSRGVCWFGEQNRNQAPTQPSLFSVTPTIPHTILTTIILYNSALIRSPGIPVTSSAYTGVGIAPSRQGFNGPRTLFAVDFNGDLSRFDDHLVEVDPDIPATAPGTANVVDVWYLDSASCPASCAPNGNIDVPQQRIDLADGIQDIDYIPGEPTSAGRCMVIIAACMDSRSPPCSPTNPLMRGIRLIPGGAWSTVFIRGTSLPDPPFQYAANYSTFDPTTQTYMMIDDGDGGIPPNFPSRFYEVFWNPATLGFRVVQSFPGWDGFIGGPSVIEPSQAPHFMKAPGRRTASIGSLDTGEQPLNLIPSGTLVALSGGVPNVGKPWLLLVAFTANSGFTLDRERMVGLDPDVLFFLTLLGIFGNQGVLDGSGNGSFTMPILPTGTMLQLQGVLLGNSAEVILGVDRLSSVVTYVAP